METTKFWTTERFPLSTEEQRLLEWLYEQFTSGSSVHTFRAEDGTQGVNLKEVRMSLTDVKTIAERLEAWGREHWNLNGKPWSGTPPVCVDGGKTELKLTVMPQIVDIWLSYEDWLRQREL